MATSRAGTARTRSLAVESVARPRKGGSTVNPTRVTARRRAAACALVVGIVASVLVVDSAPPAEASVVVPFRGPLPDQRQRRHPAVREPAAHLSGRAVRSESLPPSQGRHWHRNTLNDNNHNMVYVDADGAAFPTFNSSRSEVVLPEGSTILWAGLYWGARLTAGDNGAPAPPAGRTQMKLRPPGAAGYQTITGQVVFGPVGSDQAYQRFANITSIVQAAGTGDYWGADVAAGTGVDRYGGWSMAVVFRNPTLPLRNLTVFDGFADVGQGDPATVTISGFLAPETGPVETQLGMIAYDGDRGSSGDKALMIAPPNPDTLLGSPLSEGTNFFNSTYDINGVNITTRTPSDLNMLGFDLKNIGAPGAIPNGATTARLQFTSTGERYFPGVLTTIIDLFSPDFSPSTKTAVNLAGNDPAAPGDHLQYTLNYINAGQDPATNSLTTDPMPVGTSYVPGSLERFVDPNWVPITDGSGDDVGEFVPTAGARGSVRFRLGTGANASSGGTIAEDGGTDAVRFQVLVEGAAAGSTVVNEASLAYVPDTLGGQFTYVPNQTQTPVTTVADLSLTKTTSPDPGLAGGTITSTLTVANAGPSPAADVVVTDELPGGATFVGASPGCTLAGSVVTCAVGTVTAGGTATATVTLAIPAGSTAESLTNVAAVNSSTADPDPANNVAGSSVAVARQANLSVSKTVTPATVVPGQTTTYTVTVTNNGPSNALNVTATDTVPDPNLDLTSASAPGATCTVTVDVAQCALPALAPGAALVMTVVGRVAQDAPGGLAIGNTATGTSNTSDPDDADNTATASITTAAPQADIATTKTAGLAVAGGQVTYLVTVTNNGPSAATAVQVADLVPAGLTAVSAESSRGTCTLGAVVTCDLGDLPGTGRLRPDHERGRDDHGRHPAGLPDRTAHQHRNDVDADRRPRSGQRRRHRHLRRDGGRRPLGGEDRRPRPARGRWERDVHRDRDELRAVDGARCRSRRCPAGRTDPALGRPTDVHRRTPAVLCHRRPRSRRDGDRHRRHEHPDGLPARPRGGEHGLGDEHHPRPSSRQRRGDGDGDDAGARRPPGRQVGHDRTATADPGTPPRTFQAGETVTYFIAAVNLGPSDARRRCASSTRFRPA